MSTYIPKIDISQFSNTKKVRAEHANGEIQLHIEKIFSNTDDATEHHSGPDLGPILVVC
ncbi:MAG: hypothetical protein V4619_11840 [Bacteroidota bacterium]